MLQQFLFLVFSLLVLSCSTSADAGVDKLITEPAKPESKKNISGIITDENGTPIKGVAVSDGYQVVLTNTEGRFQMQTLEKAEFVYYTTPAEYEINVNTTALFYQKITTEGQNYNFQLKKLKDGVEEKFTFLAIGDPQIRSMESLKRFADEIVPDIKETDEKSLVPTYGLIMGDLTHDIPELIAGARNAISASGISIFSTIGNHDKIQRGDSRTTEVYTQEFGPLNYSFDRGKVHFVCLDNVIYQDVEKYTAGFTDEQVEWLKQDLQHIPDDRLIIVFYHIPLRESNSKNRTEVLELFRRFKNVHLMCGHTHYSENYVMVRPFEIYEHIHAATCGSWWHSVINGDGTPLGYGVYDVDGADITNWHYKSVRYDKSHQIRLHRGNTMFGGTYGTFSFGQKEDEIIANIWNADKYWKVEIYENDVLKGEMENVSYALGENSKVRDAWAKGYHVGVKNRALDSFNPPARHLYLYRLSDPKAQVKVVATDKFGNKYEQDQITTTLTAAETYMK